ncbi:hypothetical protein B0I33_10650 [Prauserella shujinwangii]|uniref:CAAX prenyl protease 2/Lysostaphin resistance protein A-like domain-containing protein n=1 Tax=Prauserella shujinwangii TaxID=1453103 RepID=A0A2T0LTC7_9PSEU|nr:CPBP family glutamic-type intramembrane protease [Prauserella shujinwangii]PRX46953.1 hypothetical protein B0I33_10650 [Prauserella shujinwangii]
MSNLVDCSTRSVSVTRWILLSVCVGLSAVIAWWYFTSPETFFTEVLGFGTVAEVSIWAWLLMVAVAVTYTVYTVKSVAFVDRHKGELSTLKIIGVWAAVVSGVVEEVVFRAKLMDWAMSAGFAPVTQVVISAVVFGAAHAAWIVFRGELTVVLPVVIATTLLGAMLAVVYLVAGRNILPPIIAHTVINLVIEPWLILAAVAGKFR